MLPRFNTFWFFWCFIKDSLYEDTRSYRLINPFKTGHTQVYHWRIRYAKYITTRVVPKNIFLVILSDVFFIFSYTVMCYPSLKSLSFACNYYENVHTKRLFLTYLLIQLGNEKTFILRLSSIPLDDNNYLLMIPFCYQ